MKVEKLVSVSAIKQQIVTEHILTPDINLIKGYSTDTTEFDSVSVLNIMSMFRLSLSADQTHTPGLLLREDMKLRELYEAVEVLTASDDYKTFGSAECKDINVNLHLHFSHEFENISMKASESNTDLILSSTENTAFKCINDTVDAVDQSIKVTVRLVQGNDTENFTYNRLTAGNVVNCSEGVEVRSNETVVSLKHRLMELFALNIPNSQTKLLENSFNMSNGSNDVNEFDLFSVSSSSYYSFRSPSPAPPTMLRSTDVNPDQDNNTGLSDIKSSSSNDCDNTNMDLDEVDGTMAAEIVVADFSNTESKARYQYSHQCEDLLLKGKISINPSLRGYRIRLTDWQGDPVDALLEEIDESSSTLLKCDVLIAEALRLSSSSITGSTVAKSNNEYIIYLEEGDVPVKGRISIPVSYAHACDL